MPVLQTLRVEVTPDRIGRVEMVRPEVFNAFDEVMIRELDEAFHRLSEDDGVHAIVLSGAGKVFSAGADLQWMKRASESSEQWNLEDARRFAAMLHRIETCPKPTIAQVHGLALGGGVGLICACDFAVASTESRFAVSEARFGILPAVIGPYLTNAVGKRHAKRLALLANRFGAQEAKSIGLIDEVTTRADLNVGVNRILAELAKNGPTSLAEIKGLFSRFEVGEVTSSIRELTAQTISRVRLTPEAREGFEAFLEKRAPAWDILG